MKCEIPKNIKKHKVGVFGGVALRQLLFCAAGILIYVGVFIFLLAVAHTGLLLAVIAPAPFAIPVFLAAFIEINGLYAEQILLRFINGSYTARPWTKEDYEIY